MKKAVILKLSIPSISYLIIFKIRDVVIRNPKTEKSMPITAKKGNLFFSSKIAQHNPVKLKPPIVSVVKRIFNSVLPKFPVKKIIIPKKALMLNATIRLIKNTFLKLTSPSIFNKEDFSF